MSARGRTASHGGTTANLMPPRQLLGQPRISQGKTSAMCGAGGGNAFFHNSSITSRVSGDHGASHQVRHQTASTRAFSARLSLTSTCWSTTSEMYNRVTLPGMALRTIRARVTWHPRNEGARQSSQGGGTTTYHLVHYRLALVNGDPHHSVHLLPPR